MRFSNLPILLNAVLIAVSGSACAQKSAATPDHWVGTWTAAPVAQVNDFDLLVKDTTLRQIVHVTLGGATIRVEFTNEFATRHDALTIEGATIALTSGDGVIDPASARPLTFNGKARVVVPAGAMVLSDPMALAVPAFSNLAITTFLPQQHMPSITQHHTALQTSYSGPGNQLAARKMSDQQTSVHWFFLKGVDVMAGADAGAVVTLGDSITDGSGSTPDTNHRWPDVLAQRLHAEKKTANIAVLNAGIGGNRMLHEGSGPSAIARFDHDVLTQAGVRYLIVYEGINDIGGFANQKDPDNHISAADLIDGLNQMIERAHTRGIKIYGGTITPFQGAAYYTEEGENARQAVNEFIRNSGRFDGVIDFDKMLRMPSDPHHIVDAYSGNDKHRDHQHPNDDGYKRMGEGIDLSLFER